MAGIMNKTARQYNLKCISKNGERVVVRLAPGFNIVEDVHWEAFVPKTGKGVNPYVAGLKKDKRIAYGKDFDDMELEQDADTVAKSKSEPLTKLKAELESTKAETAEANSKAKKAEEEAKEATAKAEKAELELKQLKDKIRADESKSDDKSKSK